MNRPWTKTTLRQASFSWPREIVTKAPKKQRELSALAVTESRKEAQSKPLSVRAHSLLDHPTSNGQRKEVTSAILGVGLSLQVPRIDQVFDETSDLRLVPLRVSSEVARRTSRVSGEEKERAPRARSESIRIVPKRFEYLRLDGVRKLLKLRKNVVVVRLLTLHWWPVLWLTTSTNAITIG